MGTAVRILDANLNRLMEGMRVVEEILRFHFENRQLSAEMKDLRHRLSLLIREAEKMIKLFSRRNATGDIGRHLPSEPEEVRIGIRDIFASNASRIKESLRVLEEFFKLISKDLSKKAKELRYDFYDIEKRISRIFDHNRLREAGPLYPVISTDRADRKFREWLAILADSNVGIVQLRMKNAEFREFIKAARLARKALESKLLIINDRIDVAILSGADGIHAGQEDITPSQAETIFGGGLIFGASARNAAEADKLQTSGADYIGLGPIFRTSTKKDAAAPLGASAACAIAKKSGHYWAAIGGITSENISSIKNGFDLFAVSAGIFTGDVKKNLEEFSRLLTGKE